MGILLEDQTYVTSAKREKRGQRYAGSTMIREIALQPMSPLSPPRSSKLQPDVTKKASLQHCIREGRYPFSISFLFSQAPASTSKTIEA